MGFLSQAHVHNRIGQRRGSHHRRIRRRAYPTPGSYATLREGTQYGVKGTAQKSGQPVRKDKKS